MGNYSIKDLERLSGIKAHTIRIWEKRYELIDPERTDTNIRNYSDTDLKKLLNISILNRNGLKISKIARLSNSEIAALVNKLTSDPQDSDSQLENLYIAMIDVDESLFDKIISRAVIQMGFEQMMIKLIYPFFKRMGIMWQTGAISPAQEHFISCLVRQKILVAIDSKVPDIKPNAKSFILYLPENEQHELGLMFMHYLIKKRGHRVLYLGAQLPLDNLVSIEKLRPADYIVTNIVATMEDRSVEEYLEQLSGEFPDKQILATGQQLETVKSNKQNLHILSSVVSFIDYLDSLEY